MNIYLSFLPVLFLAFPSFSPFFLFFSLVRYGITFSRIPFYFSDCCSCRAVCFLDLFGLVAYMYFRSTFVSCDFRLVSSSRQYFRVFSIFLATTIERYHPLLGGTLAFCMHCRAFLLLYFLLFFLLAPRIFAWFLTNQGLDSGNEQTQQKQQRQA